MHIRPMHIRPMQNHATRLVLSALALAAFLAGPRAALAASSAGAGHYVHRQGPRTLPELFRAELDAARKRQEGVLIMFTADWCAPCKDVKRHVAGSTVVRKALAKARMLYIDVDEWRGPAHSLLPGINPTKLPTLVKVDVNGRPTRTCYGTDLGLLSEDAVAHNLGRLLADQPPEPPSYTGRAEVEQELTRKYAAAQVARTAKVPQLAISGQKGSGTGRKVRLILRNHDGPRRWFVVPARSNAMLPEQPGMREWSQVRWTEHVRADYLRVAGSDGFAAIPVAGYGSVTLEDWPLPGPAGKVTVWELDRLAIAGQDETFQMKLPYELTIAHPEQQGVGRGGKGKVELSVRAKHVAKVK